MSDDNTTPLTTANPVAPGYNRTDGNTVGTSTDPTRSPYAQRLMPVPPMTSGPMQGASNVPPLLQLQADLKS